MEEKVLDENILEYENALREWQQNKNLAVTNIARLEGAIAALKQLKESNKTNKEDK